MNLTVTLSHCPLIGLTRWAEGCDMLWKDDTTSQVQIPVPGTSFRYLFFQGPRSLEVKEWKKWFLLQKRNHVVCDFQPLEVMMLRDTDQKGLALQHSGQVLLQQNGHEVIRTSSITNPLFTVTAVIRTLAGKTAGPLTMLLAQGCPEEKSWAQRSNFTGTFLVKLSKANRAGFRRSGNYLSYIQNSIGETPAASSLLTPRSSSSSA